MPVNAILHLIALFPFWALSLISDFFYFVIYYVARYRVKVVKNNIRNSFPEMSDKEIISTTKKFYHHFADYFIETIKLLHISDNEMRKHLQFANIDVVDNSLDQDKTIAINAVHLAM